MLPAHVIQASTYLPTNSFDTRAYCHPCHYSNKHSWGPDAMSPPPLVVPSRGFWYDAKNKPLSVLCCLKNAKFGQSIICKIVKINVATSCPILKAETHQIRFHPQLCLKTSLRVVTVVSQTPLPDLRRDISKGKGKNEWKGKGGDGRGFPFWNPNWAAFVFVICEILFYFVFTFWNERLKWTTLLRNYGRICEPHKNVLLFLRLFSIRNKLLT